MYVDLTADNGIIIMTTDLLLTKLIQLQMEIQLPQGSILAYVLLNVYTSHQSVFPETSMFVRCPQSTANMIEATRSAPHNLIISDNQGTATIWL